MATAGWVGLGSAGWYRDSDLPRPLVRTSRREKLECFNTAVLSDLTRNRRRKQNRTEQNKTLQGEGKSWSSAQGRGNKLKPWQGGTERISGTTAGVRPQTADCGACGWWNCGARLRMRMPLALVGLNLLKCPQSCASSHTNHITFSLY